jgi:Zn-dependent protease with chaperone function
MPGAPIFVLIFLTLTNWFQLLTFTSAFFGKKISKETISDKWIYETIYKNTGLKLSDITLFKDKRIYGMMAGLPVWPKMILSEGLYKTLERDELEWVVLHEAAHCVLWHNLKAFLIEVFFIFTGVVTIAKYNLNFFESSVLSVVFSLVCIQLIRWLIEYSADKFSILRVSNPMGVISAQEKIRKSPYKNMFSSEKSLGRLILHWNIYPSKRIEMAKNRMKKTND